MTIQNLPQPQFVLIIIAIPARSTSIPAGAKSRSPANAAWRASVAISLGSSLRSARRPSMVSSRPPPTQKTARTTWRTRNTAYQSVYQAEANAKTTLTTTTTPPIAAVSGAEERRWAEGSADADVSMVRKLTRRRGAHKLLDGREQHVEVRQFRDLVAPGAADGAFTVDEERRPRGDVLEAAVVEGDAEAVRRVGVPVRQEREVEVERLHPGDVRPGGVAGRGVCLDSGGAELVAPVTQELQLARSGRRPVEQIEEEEHRDVGEHLADRSALLRRRPHPRVRDALSHGQHRATLTRQSLGRDLGRLRDCAGDLHDVPVRVEDPDLTVGAVAAPQDLLDPRELCVRAELAGVRLDEPQGAPHDLRDRLPVAPAGQEVHHRRLEAVPRRQPLVLGRQDAVVRGHGLAGVEELRVVLDERLAVGGDRDHVLEVRHGVADPDLDRAEARVEADVPPDVGVVRDAARTLELPDDLRVVVVVAEARRRPRARESGEHHVSRRAQPGRLAPPERRARGERDELLEVPDQGVDDLDRLLGVVDGDVHVQPEDQLAPRDVLHLVDESVVAVLGRDPLPLEERERMRAGGADA